MRSASANTASMSCSTSTIVKRPFRERSICDQPLGLVMAGAGHRLVEQQQLRLHRKRDREFELRASRHAKLAGRRQRRVGEPDLVEAAIAGVVQRRSRRAALPKNRKLEPDARLHGERDVLQHREARQNRGDLERAREPARRARMDGKRGDVLAGEARCAGIRRKQARRSGGSASSCRRRSGRSWRAARPAAIVRVTSSVTTQPPKILLEVSQFAAPGQP